MELKILGPNMKELTGNGIRVLYFYNTPVAAYNSLTGLWYRTSKKWSSTTARHINKWIPTGVDPVMMSQDFFDNITFDNFARSEVTEVKC